MAEKKKSSNAQGGGSVSHLTFRCPVTDCGKKPHRSSFCSEHFTWFKEGLINRKGEQPKDFDKKFQAFLRRPKAA